jgi:hypothetical protein
MTARRLVVLGVGFTALAVLCTALDAPHLTEAELALEIARTATFWAIGLGTGVAWARRERARRMR